MQVGIYNVFILNCNFVVNYYAKKYGNVIRFSDRPKIVNKGKSLHRKIPFYSSDNYIELEVESSSRPQKKYWSNFLSFTLASQYG